MTPGTLVAYDRDPRYVAAFSLYVVVGEAKPDNLGRRQLRIQCVEGMGGTTSPWAPNTVRVLNAAIADLTPLAAFGYRIATLTEVTFEHGVSNHLMKVEFDPSLPVTAKRSWGQFGAMRDDKVTGIRTASLFNLIKKAMIAGYRDTRKAAA